MYPRNHTHSHPNKYYNEHYPGSPPSSEVTITSLNIDYPYI